MGKVRYPQTCQFGGAVPTLMIDFQRCLLSFCLSCLLPWTFQVLSKCSKEFLADFAQQAVPAICFHGSDMLEDVKDGLVLLMGGHADRISVDHKRSLDYEKFATKWPEY